MAAFKKDDRVLWSHAKATEHAEGSILRWPAEAEEGDGPGENKRGTILDGDGFIWTVQLDSEKEPRDLTADELVRIEEIA